MDRGALHARRPDWLADAGAAFFAQQSVAGKTRAYGAVGGADYCVEALVGTSIPRERSPILHATDLVARAGKAPEELRVLDLGTGDGHLLLALHTNFGIPWANLVGVSAEDMRGQPELEGLKEPVDLRGEAGAENSYVVWNIEDLAACPQLEGRTFDLVVSWVTFCWLTDPLGALEMVHDRFLADGGLLVCGSLQMQVLNVASIDDQCYLAALAARLRDEGHRIDVLRDHTSGVLCWWLQRKALPALRLHPLLDYAALAEESLKVEYKADEGLAAGPEVPFFDLDLVTVF